MHDRPGGAASPSAARRVAGTVADVLLVALVLANQIDELVEHVGSPVPPVAVAVVVVQAAVLALRRRYPRATLAIVATAAAGAAAMDWYPADQYSVPTIVAVYALAAHGGMSIVGGRRPAAGARARAATVLVVTSTASVVVVQAVLTGSLGVVAGQVALWTVAAGAGAAVRAARDHGARDAVAAERVRIGRDIHDTVGSALSLLAAGHVTAVVRDTADAALRELRDTVHPAPPGSGDGPSGIAGVRHLVARCAAAGLDVDLWVDPGADRRLDPESQHVAFRVVQEAVTNSMQHAPGSPMRVTLYLDEAALTIEVRTLQVGEVVRPAPLARDRARSRPGPSRTGLAGAWGRVAAAGGSMSAGPRADGDYAVSVVLPLPSAVATPAAHGPRR